MALNSYVPVETCDPTNLHTALSVLLSVLTIQGLTLAFVSVYVNRSSLCSVDVSRYQRRSARRRELQRKVCFFCVNRAILFYRKKDYAPFLHPNPTI